MAYKNMMNLVYLYLMTIGIKVIRCERLREQMYSSIEGGAACFRRLNGTHQAGCSSSLNGEVGVVQMIYNISDAQWLVHNSSAGPYMAVVSTTLYYDIIEILLRYPDNIAGILLYDNATMSPNFFTQESQCPNEYSSDPRLGQCVKPGGIVWNEKGTGLLRRDIPYPIFFLPKARIGDITKIEECYNRYNLDKDNQRGRPLCSLQLNSFMYAAVNSVVCLRRSASSAFLSSNKVCDPLGDYNVYYSLFPRAKETGASKKTVTLVTARIDSASLFDGIAPGAASSVVGLVSNIATAATLAKMIPVTDAKLYDQNVLWTLFNGEAFDYIGSQRIAYDLSRGAWPPVSPLSPSDIRLHIELGQLGGSLQLFKDSASWPIYAYAPYSSQNATAPQILEFMGEMSSYSTLNNITVSPEFTTDIPPSSLHSFRQILRNVTESGSLLEILLADHKGTFTNKFYESALDDYENIGYVYHNISIDSEGIFIPTADLLANGTMKETEAQVKIANLATTLAHTLYQQMSGKPYTGSVKASAHLVDEMLYCFLRSQACRLLLAADYASNSDELPADRPLPLYVGVAAWPSPPAVYAGHLIALLTGNHLHVNRTDCDKNADTGFSYYWLRGWNHSGICIETTMNFSQAVSPAFIKPDYDLTSGEFSSWTESVWQTIWARVFVRASGAGARLAAVTGALATAVAAILTFWLQRHSALVFIDAPSSVSSDAAGIIRTVNC
ncbi:jg2922 [Pararge aegeria aegeria]|uniref:Nicastrin n=2 Tax=Pararge aegeria TaxID=116150 RepID=A0A8S4SJ33_9NEOP|nr:jg2922 [Pararge aegeria aegeria]